MSTIHFTKMQGAGNDYIYVDIEKNRIPNPSDAAIRWSAPHTGIGSDGLILIGKSDKADFSMRMFNNDGSGGLMCGNGIRCVGKYVYDHRLTRSKSISIETKAGIKYLELHTDGNDEVTSATVDMGEPILTDKGQLATDNGRMSDGIIGAGGKTYEGTFVSMGNPHFVIFVSDIQKVNLAQEGPGLEHHPVFPQQCNIEFAEVRPDGTIRTRVWERGTGITMACGTGACATAVAAILRGFAKDRATIVMDGGSLQIEWNKDNNHIYMSGPATTVFEGDIQL